MKTTNGGILGVLITPGGEAPDAATSGMWNLQDVATYEAQNIWAQPNIVPVVTNVAPTNVTFPLDVAMSATQVITFSGATDTEDTDTALKYEIVTTSAAITSVSAAVTAAPYTFTFTTASVTVDTNVSFDVKVTDSFGGATTKSFANAIVVKHNAAPVVTNLISTPSTIVVQEGSSTNAAVNTPTTAVTFSGATDGQQSDTTLTYQVLNISSANITVTGSVSAAPYNFTFTSAADGVTVDTAVTFDVKVTDDYGLSTIKTGFNLTIDNWTVLTFGSYSHAGHVSNTGTVLHTVGSITVPTGETLDKFYIRGQNVSSNVFNYIDYINIGGVRVYDGDLAELGVSGNGSLFQTAALTIPSGSQNVDIYVSGGDNETEDRLYIAQMQFIFN